METNIQKIGEDIFHRSQASLTLFRKNIFADMMMDWAMKRPELKVEMFRFVDVLPTLKTKSQIADHLKEYFLRRDLDFPLIFKSGLKLSLTNPITTRLAALTVTRNVSGMANIFITGENSRRARKKLESLWNKGFGFTVDILGEAVVSEAEAKDYQERYLELVTGLAKQVNSWRPNPILEETSLGPIPRANISVKCSSLYSQIDNLSFKGSVEGIKNSLRPILSQAVQNGVFINLDMEQNDTRQIFMQVAEEIFSEKEFQDYPYFGIVIQAYLKDSFEDLKRVHYLSKTRKHPRKHPLTVRLVKGAYWDYETILSEQRNWTNPVYTIKFETDANYERCAKFLLDSYPDILAAFGSHNVRSLAVAMAYAEQIGLKKCDYEIQMLYGMANIFKKAIRDMGFRVREYAPVGEMLPGMAYLVRRLLENTSNEGFLKAQSFDHKDIKLLLSQPEQKKTKKQSKGKVAKKSFRQEEKDIMFANEPLMDFSIKKNRDWIDGAIQHARSQFPIQVPVIVDGDAIKNLKMGSATNPSLQTEEVCLYSLSTKKEADLALEACERAKGTWSQTHIRERLKVIRRAADLLKEQKKELIALMVLEVGKNVKEADADVCESIDFCRYYANEAEKIFPALSMGDLPGESNIYSYQPRGTAIAIAPWNFPLAILCGMTVAPLVCGNSVIMKPAEQSSAIALRLYEILQEAGVPTEALHLLPGLGEVVGDYLVKHPKVHVISFTGSRDVGLSIIREAAQVRPGQKHIKKVVAEMGGKNAVIVDDDADLDEAVVGCLYSAFGFSGQKCSALSRVIVLDNIYDKFKERFAEGLKSMKVGLAEDVSAKIGPVIDQDAKKRLQTVIKKHQDKVVGQISVSDKLIKQGNFVKPTIFEETDFQSDLGQTEFFGPVVTLFKVKNMDEAIAAMNDVDYALTGGIFSRNPANVERARRELEVGNLYINRGITGALVYRQPFGGFKLSGVGGKAGGPDYLLHFLEPRTVTENTMRRGFAPEL